jgi:prepilin-type N-terminal cleavage/methylation domain-containing protein/prepilin-type processing-associated H-X9-DG protein
VDGSIAKQSRDTPQGFTLMELLVVISIICMLMSITLPSLTRAREQGKRLVCLSNMRGLTQAWLMYSFENDDRLCSADTGWDVPPNCHWVADGPILPGNGNTVGGTPEAIMAGVLWPYAGETLKLYKCKSDLSYRLRSYALSRSMNGQAYGLANDNVKSFRAWSEITRPSERLVFIDGACRTAWMEGPFCAVRQIGEAAPEWSISDSRNITARHSDGCNTSLADGHCEYWRYRDPRTILLANYEINPVQASQYNDDLERAADLLEGKQNKQK